VGGRGGGDACPFPRLAGRGSDGRRNELNHGSGPAQILARLPPLSAEGNQEEGCRGGAPGRRPCQRREAGPAAIDREKTQETEENRAGRAGDDAGRRK
jgi:hypothetical protein